MMVNVFPDLYYLIGFFSKLKYKGIVNFNKRFREIHRQ